MVIFHHFEIELQNFLNFFLLFLNYHVLYVVHLVHMDMFLIVGHVNFWNKQKKTFRNVSIKLTFDNKYSQIEHYVVNLVMEEQHHRAIFFITILLFFCCWITHIYWWMIWWSNFCHWSLIWWRWCTSRIWKSKTKHNKRGK